MPTRSPPYPQVVRQAPPAGSSIMPLAGMAVEAGSPPGSVSVEKGGSLHAVWHEATVVQPRKDY